jgi:hypothetical protein
MHILSMSERIAEGVTSGIWNRKVLAIGFGEPMTISRLVSFMKSG